MKKDWTVQEGNLSKFLIPDEIIVNNYFSTNRVMEFAWFGIATKETLGEQYSIGKWIIKTKKNEQ
jgi:hypothetical protein